MSYGSTAGIDAKFGSDNVTAWADLNNNGNGTEIAARKTAALNYADAEINGYLSETHYRKPLATSAGATPLIIADIANSLAGCWLKDARGQMTFDEQGAPIDSLAWHRKKAYSDLEKITNGTLDIDAI